MARPGLAWRNRWGVGSTLTAPPPRPATPRPAPARAGPSHPDLRKTRLWQMKTMSRQRSSNYAVRFTLSSESTQVTQQENTSYILRAAS